MKVLVSDVLGEEGVNLFRDQDGIEVDVNTGLTPEELKEIIGDYDGLVIRSATKVTEEILSAAKNLKVVGRAGIGLDNVDIPAATKHGVAVMNTPGGNVVTTAEHAIAMMMSLTRNIPRGTSTLKNGDWAKKQLQGREVFNKTYGVIGFGNIGSIAADRARGLKMNVVIYDPMVSAETIEKAGFTAVTLDELYEQADYITIHVPKLKQTTHLLNKEAFAKMKDGVMIINCARGGIIQEEDLYTALKSGKVAGAALDVFEVEPPGDSPLFEFDNVIGTPHLGASTKEAQTNVAVAVAEQIIKYLLEDTVINAVNVPSVTGDLLKKLEPFLYLGDRIGCLQSQIIEGQFKEVCIEYSGDFDNLDMAPVTTAILKGLLAPVAPDEVNAVNAPVIAEQMGIKITTTSTTKLKDFTNLISVTVKTTEKESLVQGTIFGKGDARVVKIDKFRLEMVPKGSLALIHNLDEPGAIGSIGNCLGDHKINIARMMVGQEVDGDRNIIFLRTDKTIPEDVVQEMRDLPLIKTVTPLEL
ncbi:MAG: phosphoglycerate dehydrogenase [Desulfobacterales bacterium]|nr:phosphoglycerate dehydrogenase [Desulfobacterales bacterium]MCP4163128.1 phosphoglycerate dehydrogenase [Deltaproteobacteria bacterium]